MPSVKNRVEDLLHDYLLEEGILKDKIDSTKFDFGFIISFPPGPKSQNLSVYKPKNSKKLCQVQDTASYPHTISRR